MFKTIRRAWLIGVVFLTTSLLNPAHSVLAISPPNGNRTVRGAALWTSFGQQTHLLLAAPMAVADQDQTPGDSEESDDEADEDEPQLPKLIKLTPGQINRIRYMELRGMRMNTRVPDRVSVKMPRDTIDDFLVEMEGHPDFQGKKNRRAFLKKTPAQKLHVIARYKGAAFADRVQIRSDPEVFVAFRKKVMPLVLRGCATNGCHSSVNKHAFGFRLFNDPKRTAATAYANFIILNDLQVGRHPVIDRSHPENSLLLTYMLPRKMVKIELRHPGDVKYKPVFRVRRGIQYQHILKWIASLKQPPEDYGVHLITTHRNKNEDEDSSNTADYSN